MRDRTSLINIAYLRCTSCTVNVCGERCAATLLSHPVAERLCALYYCLYKAKPEISSCGLRSKTCVSQCISIHAFTRAIRISYISFSLHLDLTDMRLRLLRIGTPVHLIEGFGGGVAGATLQGTVQGAHFAARRMSRRCLGFRAIGRFPRTSTLAAIATVLPARRFFPIVRLRSGLFDQLAKHASLWIGRLGCPVHDYVTARI